MLLRFLESLFLSFLESLLNLFMDSAWFREEGGGTSGEARAPQNGSALFMLGLTGPFLSAGRKKDERNRKEKFHLRYGAPVVRSA